MSYPEQENPSIPRTPTGTPPGEEEKKPYVTPKGKDEREIPYPSCYSKAQVNELKRMGIKFINWKGTAMAMGPSVGTWFFDEIAMRLDQIMSCILAIVGKPGSGKTWLGLRICEIVDPAFNPETQIIFSRSHFMRILSGEIKLKPGQAILLDEAHLNVGARHWFEDLQKQLTDQIATIRSMGLMLIIVVLHRSMIDSIIRKFTLTYELHMQKRGTARVYKVRMPMFEDKVYHPFEGTIHLSVPGIDQCESPECLKCSDRDTCQNMRARYERIKASHLKTMRLESVKKAELEILKDDPIAKERDEFALLYNNKDLLKYTNKGTIDPSSVKEIFAQNGRHIGTTGATDLSKRLQWRYPELKPSSEPVV